MSPSRRGATLAEALVALLLGLLLTHLALQAGARIRSAHRELAERADMLLSFRIAGSLLRTEVAAGRGGQDWSLEHGSLDLRAFRGTGVVCGEHVEPGELLVSYTGYRSPDPDKDSLLVVDVAGGITALPLEHVGSGPATCHGSPIERPLVLHAEHVPALQAVLVRVFERGTYTVRDAALRYARGASGRQPLTPEVWTGASTLALDGAWLTVDLYEASADG